jgi:hypothetical protein
LVSDFDNFLAASGAKSVNSRWKHHLVFILRITNKRLSMVLAVWFHEQAGNKVYIYLRDKLKLPVNRDKSGIRRPVQFQILGYSFVPIYQKGVKGK